MGLAVVCIPFNKVSSEAPFQPLLCPSVERDNFKIVLNKNIYKKLVLGRKFKMHSNMEDRFNVVESTSSN